MESEEKKIYICNNCRKIESYTKKNLYDELYSKFIDELYKFRPYACSLISKKYDKYEENDKVKCPECGSSCILITEEFANYFNKVNEKINSKNLVKIANDYLKNNDFENAFCFATNALINDKNNYNAYLIKFLASVNINDLNELKKFPNAKYTINNHYLNLFEHSSEKQKMKLNEIFDICKNKEVLEKFDKILSQEDADNLTNQIDSIIRIKKRNRNL